MLLSQGAKAMGAVGQDGHAKERNERHLARRWYRRRALAVANKGMAGTATEQGGRQWHCGKTSGTVKRVALGGMLEQNLSRPATRNLRGRG